MIRIEDRTGVFRLHYDGADVDVLGKLLGLIKEFADKTEKEYTWNKILSFWAEQRGFILIENDTAYKLKNLLDVGEIHYVS